MLRTTTPSRPATIDELLDSSLIAQLTRLDLTSKKIFAGKLKGERRSKKRGESVEFADHRPYATGDDLRHIDWNIYARLDNLFMKLFLEEEDLSLHVVLDASVSMDCGEPGKFLFAQQVAMSLGYIGLINLNRVAITTLGGELVSQDESKRKTSGIPGEKSDNDDAQRASGGFGRAPADGPIMHQIRDLRGRRRTQDLARFVCSTRPGVGTGFPEAAKRIALTRRGKGVMVVISDFFMKEGYETGLRLLAGRGYDVFVIQVLSPQEVTPEGPDGLKGDLRLVDVEDNDRAEITVTAPLLKRYKQNLSAYCGGLRDFCARREMMALTVQSDLPVETLMMDYLRKRGLLR